MHIHVGILLDGTTITAGVKDNGIGFGTMILDGAGDTASLASGTAPGGNGTALMDAVASQLRGSVIRSDDSGALIQLHCPSET